MNKRLKEVRLEKKLTIKEVSSKVGVTLSAYAHYEQGIREPSLDVLKKICTVLDVTSDYLLGLSDY